jgi:ubiquinone/menaquinone biosynthesis C-methylase UbiE
MGARNLEHRGNKDLWDKFWGREREIKKVYSNEGRVCQNLSRVVDVEGKRILEVGGGSGRDSLELAGEGANCIILDYTMTPLKLVRSQVIEGEVVPGLICGDAFTLPIKDRCIDVVFHQGLMEHFREPGDLLEENSRVLRKGGYLLVDVPQRYHFYTLLKLVLIRLNRWFAGWETQYSIRELEGIIRRHRLEPVLSYGDWMSPSIFYRLTRELFFLIGLELPLYPKGLVPGLRKIRMRLREWLQTKRPAFYSFHVIGVIGKKPER